MKDLVFLLVFLPFLYLAFKNPYLGLCGWIWTIMAIPKNMLWGFSSDFRFTYLLAIATLLGLMFGNDKFKKSPFNNMMLLMVAFLTLTGISNLFTLGSSEASWSVWSDLFKAILLSTLMMSLLTTKNRIETFIFALLIGVGFNVFFEGAKFLATMGSYKIVGIKNSMMTDNNLFALATLMVIPLFLYMTNNVVGKKFRLLFSSLAGFSVVCVIGTFSRGGFVGLLVVGWQAFKVSKKKFLYITFSIIFASSALYIASDKWSSRMQTIENAEEDESFIGRTTAWKLALLAALENPVLGTGQDSIQHGHVWSYFYQDIHKFDFINPNNTPSTIPKAAHSIYFQVLGDSGFTGLFLFLTLLIKGFLVSRRLAQTANQLWIAELSRALNTLVLVYMVSGNLLSLAYYDLVYAALALIFCCNSVNQEEIKNSTSNAKENPLVT